MSDIALKEFGDLLCSVFMIVNLAIAAVCLVTSISKLRFKMGIIVGGGIAAAAWLYPILGLILGLLGLLFVFNVSDVYDPDRDEKLQIKQQKQAEKIQKIAEKNPEKAQKMIQKQEARKQKEEEKIQKALAKLHKPAKEKKAKPVKEKAPKPVNEKKEKAKK